MGRRSRRNMNFLDLAGHIFFRLETKQKDHGVCLVWSCPRCGQPKEFRLIEARSAFTLLGRQFSSATDLLDFRCSGCGYEFKVDPSERPLVERLREITRRFREGQLKPDAYKSAVRQLPARFARDLVALTETWKCTSCGEENPVNFGS